MLRDVGIQIGVGRYIGFGGLEVCFALQLYLLEVSEGGIC